ncbi:hypothetical protein [Methylocystis sp.]|uniref:hypothetical protein n=1 Tax=Methylocystis sp. TaxID=1911079 RepID=UPI0025F819D9|nr:hypothetical protein [Methylocystis sp.]
MTQMNLGNALQRLGERESGTDKLNEAVAAYRETLKEITRDRAPLQWAMTQMNLGNALQTLGERESGTGKLNEAVAAYREALKEYARDRVPLEWARTTGNQGVALMRLAERQKNAQTAATALRQIDAAREVMRAGGHAPDAAYYESRLLEARALVDGLKTSARKPK